MTTTPSKRAAEFCDAMEARHGYRPRVRDGELVNGRDADRFAGWMLATEALRLPAGEDWVLVPREPTDAMRDAFRSVIDNPHAQWHTWPVRFHGAYQAALAAAPRHEAGE